MDILSRYRIVVDQDSKMDLNDELLCTVCRNAVWKPVYCGQCQCIFCYHCRPQIGFFNRISTFFGAERPRHGPNNCDNFEEVVVPIHITTELSKQRVRCAYEQNGCRMLPYYDDLERHENQCTFENVPCEICQLPLSRRPPIANHSKHACFEEMLRKNPAGIQQQMMVLLDATEKTETENRRLKSRIEDLEKQMNNFKSNYVKKSAKKDEQ